MKFLSCILRPTEATGQPASSSRSSPPHTLSLLLSSVCGKAGGSKERVRSLHTCSLGGERTCAVIPFLPLDPTGNKKAKGSRVEA